MSVPEVALAVILAGWWLLSMVAQFQLTPIKKLRYKDVLHLIPSWRFLCRRRSVGLSPRIPDSPAR